MRKIILSLIALTFVSIVSQVRADEGYILQSAYFEDKTNALSLDQIRDEKFTSYQGWLAKGYSPSTYWIKLNIRPSDQDLVLRIRPTFAETIQLFDDQSVDSSRITGAKYPWKESDIQSYNHNFKLGALQQEREILLRVKSNRSYLLSFDVMPAAEYLGRDHIDGLLYIGYIVFTLTLALGLLGAWLANRELVLGVFTIQQFFAFFHTFFVVGYARIFLDRYIDVSTVNYLAYAVVVSYPFIAILANKLLFEEYGLKPTYRYLFNGLSIASFVVISLLLLGYINESLNFNAQLVMAIIGTFCLTAWLGTLGGSNQKNINLPINVLRIYYSLNLLMWSISVLPLLGIVQGKDLTIHSYLLYNVLSGLIFFLLLQYRARAILKNETLKSAALKKEAEYEKFRREEQGKLMAMLTHEIRTPLSVLKLVVDRKVTGSELEQFANRAVSNIDSIIDKCIQLDRLDFNALSIHKTAFNFSELLLSVISDTHQDGQFTILGDDHIEIRSDRDIVRIIASNLIVNAAKYSVPHSKIQISTSIEGIEEDRRLKLTIQNEISSVGAPDPSLVFDKYYRGAAAAKISGSGLGLFLVRELTYALAGDVKCHVNHDSITFTVWIPI
jgi:signal transduction histidine kinase